MSSEVLSALVPAEKLLGVLVQGEDVRVEVRLDMSTPIVTVALITPAGTVMFEVES